MASTSAAATAGASSSLAATLSPKQYDVFISFRGKDTRRTLTSHLHDALCRNNIETYIDNRLDKGDVVWSELVKAIHDSSIFLVILSENYASSSWCLKELIEIMECQKKGHVVFPVFYNVEPSDVRKQTGSYQTAFDKHMSKQSDDTVQKWKAALSEVADVSGFHSSSYRTESDLIVDIVKKISQKLINKYLDKQGDIIKNRNYAAIKSFLKNESEVQIIGIWGMGGIGKTTIATAVLKEFSSQYQRSYFLANVREGLKGHEFDYLVSKPLYELGEEYSHVDAHTVKVSSFFKNIFWGKKVLVVLDDVKNSKLWDELVEKRDCLGAGSTVIVTTRDKHLLNRVDQIYEVEQMDYEDSHRLFCKYAFSEKHPQQGHEELLEKAIDYAKGLPLALKVLGSFFHSKSKNEWDSALARLKKFPDPDIQKVLRLSYDELEDTEKDIFLDIAFFFKGDEQERVINTLNACEFYAEIGIRTLLNKALITITSFNCIKMHDLIQEMGWKIVREESTKNPGKRSRLRDSEEVCDLLQNNKGTTAVEGILLDMCQITNLNISSQAFKKMPNLRILAFKGDRDEKIINSVYPTKGFELLANKLRYFQWDKCPLKSLSSTFCAKNLVEISMPNGNVEKLWSGVQNIPNLKSIGLYGCKRLLEIPDLSGAPNLKSVELRGCESLRHLHPSIFSLNKLELLFVSGCTALKSLCSNTCSPSLRCLLAHYCFQLEEFSVTMGGNYSLCLGLSGLNEVPSSILNLRNLEVFTFPICESLMNLPENFADSIHLSDAVKHERDALITLRKVLPSPAFLSVRKLCFRYCHTLPELPDNIWLLSSLERLDLAESDFISLPESIKYLPRLTHLYVSECEKLRSVPALPQSIVFFDASSCKSLKTVLSSKSEPPKKHRGAFLFQNCIELDQDAHSNILKDAIVRIELAAKPLSAVVLEDKRDLFPDEENCIYYFLPARGGNVGDCFHYCSTHALLTVELPPNSKFLGFVLYVYLSAALLRDMARAKIRFECECYMETSWGERFHISGFDPREVGLMHYWRGIISDHVLLWNDAESCEEIMKAIEKTKAINEGHTPSNPKLTFKVFACDSYGDKVIGGIKEWGLHWIEEEGGPKFEISREIYELEDSAVQNEVEGSESEEEEEAVPPTKKVKSFTIGGEWFWNFCDELRHVF